METNLNTFDGRLIPCQALPPKRTIFGQSEGMRGLWQIVEQVAGASVPILVLGEKGTGKETLARFIHTCSPGSSAPFLKLGPPPPRRRAFDEVAFRVEPGNGSGPEGFDAYAGSPRRNCTLFVDEVCEVSPGRQLELLQLIQGYRSFISSDSRDIPVNLRVIAASTQDLEKEVAAGNFREDLFSFLSVVTLRLPPLRDRKEDIPHLANYFWQTFSERFGSRPPAPSSQLINRLQQHDWPGNLQEMENVMRRYVVLGLEGSNGFRHAAPGPRNGDGDGDKVPAIPHSVSLKEVTREATQALERKIILKTLQETQWNRRRTARVLNISYRALLYKIKAAGLLSERPDNAVRSHRKENSKPNHEAA